MTLDFVSVTDSFYLFTENIVEVLFYRKRMHTVIRLAINQTSYIHLGQGKRGSLKGEIVCVCS